MSMQRIASFILICLFALAISVVTAAAGHGGGGGMVVVGMAVAGMVVVGMVVSHMLVAGMAVVYMALAFLVPRRDMSHRTATLVSLTIRLPSRTEAANTIPTA